MDTSIFAQLTLVLVIAAGISLVMRLLRQPLILGYILTGIIVGPSLLNIVHAKDAFESFSEIGITLLLFIIGLGLNVTVIKNVGRVALITAASILALVGIAGFAASEGLGFGITQGILIGLALFFPARLSSSKSSPTNARRRGSTPKLPSASSSSTISSQH